MENEKKKSTYITIPYTPISMNQQERMHWMKWHKIKKQWINDVFYLVKEHGKAIPMHRKHIWITSITIYFDRIRYRDESNYAPMVIKPLLDALVYAKIIDNDTAEYVTRPGKVNIELDAEPRTEIVLEYEI